MIPIQYTTDSSKTPDLRDEGPWQNKGPHSASSQLEVAQRTVPEHERRWRDPTRLDDGDDVRHNVWKLKESAGAEVHQYHPRSAKQDVLKQWKGNPQQSYVYRGGTTSMEEVTQAYHLNQKL